MKEQLKMYFNKPTPDYLIRYLQKTGENKMKFAMLITDKNNVKDSNFETFESQEELTNFLEDSEFDYLSTIFESELDLEEDFEGFNFRTTDKDITIIKTMR